MILSMESRTAPTRKQTRQSRQADSTQELLVSKKELARLLGISISTINDHLRHGPSASWQSIDLREIKTVRIGSRLLFVRKSIEAVLGV